MDFFKNKDWKIHCLALVMVIIAEWIGIKRYQVGPVVVLLLPILYALVMGMFLSPLKLVTREDMEMATSIYRLSVMFLVAKMGTTIGPNIAKVFTAGPALLLQEFGNLGTIFLALPVCNYS